MKAKHIISTLTDNNPENLTTIILDGQHLATGPLDQPITLTFVNGRVTVEEGSSALRDLRDPKPTQVTGTGSKPSAKRRGNAGSTEDK